ncbi:MULTISPECIES: FeoA family protein [Arcobacter]|uniref:Ferrous iron transport protein A n=2 Tax=Arcobacter TaxID=28196 RepID=A0A4Q0UXW6_9BACT|nr:MULTISPECIES: ferrous iron transport protein A [Arcobacter]MCB9097394.1 ferrous iron transport protein A [Arcobacter sp.]NCB13852.1 ferrous iron transport protein A [Erysipelotrichia bacterium]QKE25530.1 ferrous iron transport protein A [Arcobacter aquimarinus]QKF89356.1 ferrous iron transport protein A [Arcobacter cloacae]RXI33178.1 ferrous iron transport protein A [Arcobacter aquimarinus]
MGLDEIKKGNIVKILKLNAQGRLLYKLLDMGFVNGASIEIIREAPLYDPMELKIQNYHITLRKSEAKLIEVEMI